MSDLIERIREAAKNKGITSLTVLETTLGFGNGTIGKWKTQDPRLSKITAVADYLEVSVDYLMGRTDNPRLHIQEVETEKGTAELRVSKPLTDEEIEKFREMLQGMDGEK